MTHLGQTERCEDHGGPGCITLLCNYHHGDGNQTENYAGAQDVAAGA